jgi:hypothetical protein
MEEVMREEKDQKEGFEVQKSRYLQSPDKDSG